MTDVPLEREFWSDVLRRIARRAGRHADSEDLLHSAFLRLERYRHQHAIGNPKAFLVRAALNIQVDEHRHNQLSGTVAADLVRDADVRQPLQDEVIVARARLERVKAGLEKLPPRTREVFLMHRLEDLKYREIACRLGISQSAVEKHIAKAVLFLTEMTEGW